MLTEQQKILLIQRARQASAHAYAPYSNYPVGAAVLCGSSNIYHGCNVENASYGLTMCAERTAIFAARSHGETQLLAVAVHAPNDPPPIPCGACRQVMAEGGQNPLVLIIDSSGRVQEFQLTDLLPFSFTFTPKEQP